MAGSSRIVASFGLDATQAKQELDSLRQAEEQFVQAGNTLAADLTRGFEEIEQGVGKAFDKLNDGGKVSQGTFDTLVNKLSTLRQAIEDSGKPLEEMPEEFKTAFDTATRQMAGLAEGMTRQKLAAQEIKEEFQKLADAAIQAGDGVEQGNTAIRQSAERAEVAFEQFSKTLIENPKEAVEQLPRVAGAVIQLRREIEKAQAAGGPVDPQDLAQLRQFEQQLETTKQEAASFKREIDRATAGVNDAAQSWQGFDGIVNDLAGRMGKVGIAAVGAWAALSEGIRVGQELNQFFGTDMSEWDKTVDRFGEKFNLRITTTMDSLMAATQMFQALLSGDSDEIKKAYQAAVDAGNAAQKAHQDILTKWGADWDLARPKVDDTTKAVDRHTDAVKRNADALRDQADAHVKAFQEATEARIQATTDKIKQQIDASLGLADATQQVAAATDESAAASANAAAATGAQVTAIEAELDAVRALLAERGVDLDARKQMQQINLDAGASTEYLLQKEKLLSDQLATQVTSWTATSTLQTEQIDAKAQLAAIVEREKAAQEGLTKSVGAIRVEYENGVAVIKNTTDETGKLVGVLENGRVTYTNLDDAQRKATASGITFGEGTKEIKQSAAEAAEVMRGLDSTVASVYSNMNSLAAALDAVNGRLREMKTATEAASGSEGDDGSGSAEGATQ